MRLVSRFEIGVALALANSALLAVMVVVNRYALLALDLEIPPLMLTQLLAGGATLLALGWALGARGARALWRAPQTWGIAAARCGNWLLYFIALLHLSATEAELLLKWNVLMAIGLAFWLGGRRPQGPVGAIAAAALLAFLLLLSASAPGAGLLCLLGASACLVIEGAVAERHPALKDGLSFAESCVFAGAAMAATAVVAAGCWAAAAGGGLTEARPLDMFAPAYLALAALAGAALRAGCALCRFRSIPIIGGAYLMAVNSVIPFLVMAIELRLDRGGWLAATTLTPEDAWLGAGAALASLVMVADRIRSERRAAQGI